MSSYQITASASTTRLFEDTPKPLEQAVVRAVLRNERTLPAILNKAINGINWRMASYYQHGRDHSIFGLPTDKTTSIVLKSERVEERLNLIEGGNYVIENIKSVPADDEYFTTKYLYNIRGYDRYLNTVVPINDRLTAIENSFLAFTASKRSLLESETEKLLVGLPVDRYIETSTTLNGVAATLCQTFTVETSINYSDSFNKATKYTYDSYERHEEAGQPLEYTLNYLTTTLMNYRGVGVITYQESVSEFYRYADGSTTTTSQRIFDPQKRTFTLPKVSETVTYIDSERFTPTEQADVLFYIVEYHTIDTDGKKIPKYYFTYDDFAINPGGPEENAPVHETIIGSGESDYYPIVPLRNKNQSLVTGDFEGSAYYRSIVATLEKLDIDAHQLADALESNPDIDQIDEAMFMLAVSADTQDNASITYLIKYFEYIIDVVPELSTPDDYINGNDAVSHNIHIEEGNVDIKVEFGGIERKLVQGKIGHRGYVENIIDVNGTHDKWFLRKQVSDDQYVEIYIVDPVHKNYVYGDGVITTKIRKFVEDPDNKNFIIPLKRGITDLMNNFDLQELHYQSAMLVAFAYEKRRLKWYERVEFKVLLVVVSIIVLISTGIDLYTAIATAASASAAAVAVATLVLEKYLISLGLEYAVEVLGIEAAFVIAIIAIASGAYAELSGTEVFSLGPSELLELTTGISKAISTNIQKDMLEFQAEVTAFQGEASDLMDELEQKKELLKSSNIIDPFYFVNSGPIHDFNEEPSNFYRRTTQTNIADLSYAAIEKFAEVNLSLPKPKFNQE